MIRRNRQSGVTLIEMMIVLAIMGVITGAATLSLASLGADDSAERAARRLAQDIAVAVDSALIDATPRKLTWDQQGYMIARRVQFDQSVRLSRADGQMESVMIAPDVPAAVVEFVLAGDGPDWTVTFDGFSVEVSS